MARSSRRKRRERCERQSAHPAARTRRTARSACRARSSSWRAAWPSIAIPRAGRCSTKCCGGSRSEGAISSTRGDPTVERLARLEAEVRENRAVITAGPFVPIGASLGCAPDRRRAVRGLRSLTPCEPDRVRSRPGRCADRARRRAARRSGGSEGRAVRRAGGRSVRSGRWRKSGCRARRLYVTNAVKHFKFTPRGKRRIHQTPGPADIAACRPWIEAELELLRPRGAGVPRAQPRRARSSAPRSG